VPRVPRVPGVLAFVAAVLVAGNLQVSGQTPQNVELDPIRCWWRTSTGAVRIGETFSVVLTCAVLQNEAVQVIPDSTQP
jgi:hypothetical protein